MTDHINWLAVHDWLLGTKRNDCHDAAGRFCSGSGVAAASTRLSRAKIVFKDEDADLAAASKVFGREVTGADLASAVGAPDDAKVWVTVEDGGKRINVATAHESYESSRSFERDNSGNLFVSNNSIEVYETGAGVGTKVFADQVQQCERLGVKYISANPAGKAGSAMNGYYTWPRLGYDATVASMAPNMKQMVEGKYPDAKRLSDVLKKPGGSLWWKENGFSFFAEFDLKQGSHSRRTLAAYLEERKSSGKKSLSASAKDSGRKAEEIDLSPEEEAALERAWERLYPEEKRV